MKKFKTKKVVAALCAAVITTVGAVNMALPASAVMTYENR